MICIYMGSFLLSKVASLPLLSLYDWMRFAVVVNTILYIVVVLMQLQSVCKKASYSRCVLPECMLLYGLDTPKKVPHKKVIKYDTITRYIRLYAKNQCVIIRPIIERAKKIIMRCNNKMLRNNADAIFVEMQRIMDHDIRHQKPSALIAIAKCFRILDVSFIFNTQPNVTYQIQTDLSNIVKTYFNFDINETNDAIPFVRYWKTELIDPTEQQAFIDADKRFCKEATNYMKMYERHFDRRHSLSSFQIMSSLENPTAVMDFRLLLCKIVLLEQTIDKFYQYYGNMQLIETVFSIISLKNTEELYNHSELLIGNGSEIDCFSESVIGLLHDLMIDLCTIRARLSHTKVSLEPIDNATKAIIDFMEAHIDMREPSAAKVLQHDLQRQLLRVDKLKQVYSIKESNSTVRMYNALCAIYHGGLQS